MSYLSAEAVLTAFSVMKKRHLILTGSRGIGKSTLLAAILGSLHIAPSITSGFDATRTVVLTDHLTKASAVIGRPCTDAFGCKRMQPVSEGFRDFGVAAIERLLASDLEYVSVDEIGFLETGFSEYCDALRRLFTQKRVLAVVRKQELPFLTELCNRPDALVIDLDHPFDDSGFVIMASGLAKRFGSNKLLTSFKSQPLYRRVLELTGSLMEPAVSNDNASIPTGISRVVVTRHQPIAEYCREHDIPVVLHDLPFRSDTVRLGVKALMEPSPDSKKSRPLPKRILFLQSDQPLLRKETLEALLLCSVSEPERIVRPCFGSREGAPICFPHWALDALCALPEGKGGGFLAKQHPEAVQTVPVAFEHELTDIDTSEDLTFLEGLPFQS